MEPLVQQPTLQAELMLLVLIFLIPSALPEVVDLVIHLLDVLSIR